MKHTVTAVRYCIVLKKEITAGSLNLEPARIGVQHLGIFPKVFGGEDAQIERKGF